MQPHGPKLLMLSSLIGASLAFGEPIENIMPRLPPKYCGLNKPLKGEDRDFFQGRLDGQYQTDALKPSRWLTGNRIAWYQSCENEISNNYFDLFERYRKGRIDDCEIMVSAYQLQLLPDDQDSSSYVNESSKFSYLWSGAYSKPKMRLDSISSISFSEKYLATNLAFKKMTIMLTLPDTVARIDLNSSFRWKPSKLGAYVVPVSVQIDDAVVQSGNITIEVTP